MPIEFNLPSIPSADAGAAAGAGTGNGNAADAFLTLFLSAAADSDLSAAASAPIATEAREDEGTATDRDARDARDAGAIVNDDTSAILGLMLSAQAAGSAGSMPLRDRDNLREATPLAGACADTRDSSAARDLALPGARATDPKPTTIADSTTIAHAGENLPSITEGNTPAPAATGASALALASNRLAELRTATLATPSSPSADDSAMRERGAVAAQRATLAAVIPGPEAPAGQRGAAAPDAKREMRAALPVEAAAPAAARAFDVALPPTIIGADAKGIASTATAGRAASAERTDAASAAAFATPSNYAPIAAPVITIAAPVGTPAWRDEVAQQMSSVVLMRQDRAEFQLHPADLGPIDVRVSMDAGQATLLISAPQPATRDALELALPNLRDALAQQGIALGQATVQDERPRDPRDFSDTRAQRAGAGSIRRPGALDAIAVPLGRLTPRGLVDTFA